MTEAIEFHNVIGIHTIHATQAKGFFFISLNAVSCFKHQYKFEIDTLPVHVQEVLFQIEFRNLTFSPISKSTNLG